MNGPLEQVVLKYFHVLLKSYLRIKKYHLSTKVQNEVAVFRVIFLCTLKPQYTTSVCPQNNVF